MKTHKIVRSLMLLSGLTTASLMAQTQPTAVPPEETGPKVQLALLLDTSGSMDGLIDQARSQIWQVVNTFISAKQNGKPPMVEVALYEYGNSGLSSEKNYIRQLQPLTRDLDAVSESLFSLKTNGGEEYCGAVIQRATQDLKWDPSPDTYKAIFIAGNEPFTQGPIPQGKACKEAIGKAIIVNTIHCGGEAEGANTGWKEAAKLADGRYLVIDQNQAVIAFEAPQDAEIAKLNESLNQTYVAYGTKGEEMKTRQSTQDSLVAPGAKSARIAGKSSALYKNSNWDLVDAVKDNAVKLEELPRAQLPAELRDLPPEKLNEAIEKKQAERNQIQQQIQTLSKEREAFITQEKQKASTAKQGETLDSAMITAVRSQAEKKGVVFVGQ